MSVKPLSLFVAVALLSAYARAADEICFIISVVLIKCSKLIFIPKLINIGTV